MPFNSYTFVAAFLPIVLAGYLAVGHAGGARGAKLWLVATSLVFYAWGGLGALPLLLASMAGNFVLGDLVSRESFPAARRRRLLAWAVAANVMLLGVFKYSRFVLDNVNGLLGTHLIAPDLQLPPGISFFTFLQIAYLVDRHRGATRPSGALDYTLFVSFFPKLLVGPIARGGEILPQLDRQGLARPAYENLSVGTFLFFLGLFKKVVLADSLARWANAGFAGSDPLTLVEAWAASLSYTLQLYFDFSGYSDMAIGISQLFNIRVPENFLSPYRALDLQDFWRRWHVTLSRFLRDYVYIPLGGNREGTLHTYRNLLLTFLIGGVWHGAGWGFVIWGLLHGVGIVVHRAWHGAGMRLPRPLAWFVTFNFVNVAWVFFRAPEFGDALRVLRGMVGLNGVVLHEALRGRLGGLAASWISFGAWPHLPDPGSALAFLLLGGVAASVWRNSMELRDAFRFDWIHKLATIALAVVSLLSLTHVSEFVYTQF